MYSALNMPLLFVAGFSSEKEKKKMGNGSLVLYCLIFQIFVQREGSSEILI
jgi:hypothetical protein